MSGEIVGPHERMSPLMLFLSVFVWPHQAFLIFCLFSFTGKYAFLGTIKEQKINTQMLLAIEQDREIPINLFKSFESILNNDNKIPNFSCSQKS